MKRIACVSMCLMAFTLFAHPFAAQMKMQANPGFEKMKTLVGEWEGKTQNGKIENVSYRLVSGGTALEETLQPSDEPAMLTLYSADGARVALTHFCPMNNQPRMCSAPIHSSPQKIDFTFTGATNLASPVVGHMHHLTVQIQDNDHFSQTWTWRENGKDKIETFHFARKK